MSGDAMGVILVIVLGGLVVPVVLLLSAALFEVVVASWALGRYGYDGASHALQRLTHRSGAHGLHPSHRH